MTTRIRLEALPYVPWGKSDLSSGHPLILHLLDVASVVEAVLRSEPESTLLWASRQFGLPQADCSRWIAALAGLHDFGKAIPGFQAKWPAGMKAVERTGLGFTASACGVDRHDLATASLLGPVLQRHVPCNPGWLGHMVQAVSAHHGYHFLAAEIEQGRPLNEEATWKQMRSELLAAYWQVLLPKGDPNAEELSLAAVNWLAGLTSVADWIASNPDWFPLGSRGHTDLVEYYAHAGSLAQTALAGIGWRAHRCLCPRSDPTDALIARIVGRPGIAARPLQSEGDRLLQAVSGPALLLVEAPMGEGKTELAFLAHLRLQAANEHRGLYVALPTQATGNALFARALKFLGAFSEAQLDVQLVHGGAAMNAEVQHLRGIANSSRESLSASSWFSQRRRPLLSAYGVGTVDQALFATLNVKHHFVRLWGLGNRVVVLDEVHAYDTYTSGLISALLRWLRALGCSVVLMSATLPRQRRDEFLRAWGVEAEGIPSLPYPRLILADGTGVKGSYFDARPLAEVELSGISESLEDIADQAARQVELGGCGAVIVNTVDRAQKLFELLRERVGSEVELVLFHARFPADERAELERRVLQAFGEAGNRPACALMVATQVAEQSLDIDFDFMLSDLAPVDLLLQRAGRLHRHSRPRPDHHSQARLVIAGLSTERLPDLDGTAWGYVYDAYILLRTWALLGREHRLDLPSDIDRLVQAVYADEPLPGDLEDTVREVIEIKSYGEYLARLKKERQESFNIAINPFEEPQIAYNNKPRGSEEGEGVGLENRTRLGPPSVTIIPVSVVDGRWCVRQGSPLIDPDRPTDNAVARDLYSRQLKVSRRSLVRHFASAPSPVAFEHPLLRDAHPLPLVDGCVEIGGLRLRLDPLLGLVYESDTVPLKESA